MIRFVTNITILIKYYGTYLSYLVQELIGKSEKALTAKEIAAKLNQYSDPREQYNLTYRVRRVINQLYEDGQLAREQHKGVRNILFFKYKMINDESTKETGDFEKSV